MEHLIKNKKHTIHKLNSILKSHSPSNHPNQLIAPQMPTSVNKNLQLCTKPVASKSLHCKKLKPFAPQLTHSNATVNPYSNTPFASQMPCKLFKPQFVPDDNE